MKNKHKLLTILTLSLLIFQISCSDDEKDLKTYHKLRSSLYGTWIIDKGEVNVQSNHKDVEEFILKTLQSSLTDSKDSYQMEIQLGRDANGQEEDVCTDNLDNYGTCSIGLGDIMNIFYNKKNLYWDDKYKHKKIALKYEKNNNIIYSLQTTMDKKEGIKELVSTQFDYDDIEITLAEISYILVKK